jgi:ArsR family transcriptional regulator, arsenate/arsenite/antimonite-responsive transcriptional repressor
VAHTLKERARLFRDLGHPARLKILCILAREGRQCVCRMLPELEVPQPTLSRHLAVLRGHGLIEDEREGTMVFYRIADESVLEVMRAAGLPCACGRTKTSDLGLKAGRGR